jgi:trans-aconitate 2-methyltransferase
MPDTDTWFPATYLQFEDERTRAARDLLAQVPLVAARKVVDVGCGPGNSTALLVARYPGAEIVGIDSSPAMLEEARRVLPDGLFIEADANIWLPNPDTDLVFANATYHWIPGHLTIFRRILSTLRPGAVLAVQMPDNLAEPAWRRGIPRNSSQWLNSSENARRLEPRKMPRNLERSSC